MGLGKTYSADYLIDSNGNTGVSGQVLISTATGIDWADGTAITGGPFLPLAGGTITGNVGIGAASPSSKLHVAIPNQALGFDSGIFVSANPSDYTVGRGAGITFQNADSYTGGVFGIREANNWTGALAFYTHTSGVNNVFGSTFTEKMRIDSAGSVGIGDTSPTQISANTFSLSVNSSRTDLSGGLISKANGTVKHQQYWDTGGYNFSLAASSGNFKFTGGNVGIGTTAPSFQLSIENHATTTSTATLEIDGKRTNGTDGPVGEMIFSNDGDTFATVAGFRDGADNKGSLQFQTQDSTFATRMTISSEGNVGIGTTDPTSALTIKGTSPYIRLERAGVTTWEIRQNYPATEYGFQIVNVTAGTIPFFVGASNNVGIGTTSPERKLHVYSGSAGTVASSSEADLVVENNDHTAINLLAPDNKQSAIYFGTPSDNIGGGIYWNYSSKQLTIASMTTSGHITFRAGNNSEKMRITSTGNVGIGTTTPYSNLWVSGLGINAASELTTTDTTSNAILALAGTNSLVRLQMGTMDVSPWGGWIQASYDNTSGGSTSGVAPLLLNPLGGAAGNVGIGTTAPGTINGVAFSSVGLHVKAGTLGRTITEGTSFAEFIMNHSGASANQKVKYLMSKAGVLELGSMDDDGTRRGQVSILNNNNVGIGTTAPEKKLHIKGATNDATPQVLVQNGGTGDASVLFNVSGQSYVVGIDYDDSKKFKIASSGNLGSTDRITLLSTGQVGIGTITPEAKLHVTAGSGVAFKINPNDAAKEWYIDTTNPDHLKKEGNLNLSADPAAAHASTKINFLIDGSNKMRIQDNGNVGISTTSPSYALDVTGTIRATGNVIAYSDARVKENVETIPNALNKVNAMRGVGYNKIGEEERSVGVIAQELLEVLPEAVHQDEQGMYSVAYGNITGVLIEAIKELTKEIKELKKQIK